MKRLISLLLVFVLVLGMIPFSAMALEPEETFETETYTHINPLYADVITEEDLVFTKTFAAAPDAHNEPVYATNFAEAGKQLRQQMVNRESTIAVYYQTTNYDSGQHKDIFNAAVAHTGDPDEGDALRWVYAGYRVGVKRSVRNGVIYVTFTYSMNYYTTAEQEAELQKAIDDLLATVNPNASKYEQFKTVYDYICANITYDYDTLYDDTYKLKFTAYAALINKTAVCQGYAILLYQLALELGIDCRVITGIGNGGGHGWNIVKFGDYYYNTDATWDATWYQALGYYNYYLQNEVTFTEGGTDHYRDAEYNTTEFHALYPISPMNFDPSAQEPDIPDAPDPNDIGKGLSWNLDNGTLTIFGNGEMIDYAAPWYDRCSEINTIVIEPGVTKIGACAFEGCDKATVVKFMGSAPRFGDDNVFGGVKATVFYPVNDASWTGNVKQNYGGILAWQPMCLGHEWSAWIQIAVPTCEQNGAMSRTCALCGACEEELIPAQGHSYAMYVTEPTCTGQGYITYTCTRCPDTYKDTYVNALGHKYGNNWCVNSIAHWYECERCYIVNDQAFHTDNNWDDKCDICGYAMEHTHHVTLVSALEATCTEPGHTAYYICSGCGEWFMDAAGSIAIVDKSIVVVATLDHDYESVVTAPTCTETGYTTHTCIHCGDTYKDTYMNALGHTGGTATCKDKAICTRCSNAYGELNKSNHTGGTEIKNAKAATCTTAGYTGDTYCKGCNVKISSGQSIAATGHSYSYAVTTAPTTAVSGKLTGTCAKCGGIDVVELPALNKTDYTYTIVKESTMEAEGTGRYTWKVSTYGEIRFDVALDKLSDIRGDINGDKKVNDQDVIALLWHTLFPDLYPIDADGDINGDGKVNDQDVIALLWHTLFPTLYPL